MVSKMPSRGEELSMRSAKIPVAVRRRMGRRMESILDLCM